MVCPPGAQKKDPPFGVAFVLNVTDDPGQNVCAVPEIVGVGLTVTTT